MLALAECPRLLRRGAGAGRNWQWQQQRRGGQARLLHEVCVSLRGGLQEVEVRLEQTFCVGVAAAASGWPTVQPGKG